MNISFMGLKKVSFEKTLIVFFVLFFVSDFITSVVSFYLPGSFSRFAAIIKLIFQGLLFCIIIYNWKRVDKKLVFVIVVLIISFIIGNISMSITMNSNLFEQFYSGNIYFSNKYLYVFFFILSINTLNVSTKSLEVIVINFRKIMLFNSIAILIGVLFEINFFKSYQYSSRFGYRGFFSVAGLALHSYILVILFVYNKYISKKKKSHLFEVLFFAIISILIGKKTMLLFLFLLVVFHFCFVIKQRKIFTGVFVLFSALAFLFKERILSVVILLFDLEESLKKHGLTYIITSSRNDLYYEAMDFVNKKWSELNYVFGGFNYREMKVEYEFVDVFLFFGITGLISFSYLYIKYFLSRTNYFGKAFFLIVILTCFFSGGFLIDVVFMMLFFILIAFVLNKENP